MLLLDLGGYTYVRHKLKQKIMEPDLLKRYCSNCQTETLQTVKFREVEISPAEIIGRNEEGDKNESAWVIQGNVWLITKCNGCEKLNLTVETKHVGNEKAVHTFSYPRLGMRKIPEWTFSLPIKYVEILSEVYSAINEKTFRLALMGSRLLIETFILEKVGDVGTFKNKLGNLLTEGYISKRQKEFLDSALDAGNAASHRGYNPDEQTIKDTMDIVENLLQSEILERKAKTINQATPKRK